MQENFNKIYLQLLRKTSHLFKEDEISEIKRIFTEFGTKMIDQQNDFRSILVNKMKVAVIVVDEVGLGKAAVLSVVLYDLVNKALITVDEIDRKFNTRVGNIMMGISKVKELYQKNTSLETENFRKLLLTFAEDVRVILIILSEQLLLMRNLQDYPEDIRVNTARETSFLYAPLAHRMGLYAIKTELEDLSLKFTNREIYSEIASKINQTKKSRDKYIYSFIEPLQLKLDTLGYSYSIKGRTKSIHSIFNKIRKQNTTFENIYDLFAIRIIFDVEPEKEKTACWQAYSIVADMYQPNPKRLRDWLSIPKSNGYESLHTTVLGPQGKWVEVQIRTERMDEIAEKGLAAHWKYKGVKSDSNMEEWLKGIREILENPDLNAVDVMDEFKLNLYDKEVFVFTPNGDLHKLPKGATILDFAFSIHTGLGVKCVGARVNGKNMSFKQVLTNGDQVEILTSPTQKPNQGWLQIVTSSKAKNKIRQALKEIEYKDAEIGRETLLRRFKNWKLEVDDGKISKLAKKMGFKTVSDFYQNLANEEIDIHNVKDVWLDLEKKDHPVDVVETRSAEGFVKEVVPVEKSSKEDVLIIGEDLKNVDFKLAKCCNPIYGDDVFGFVSVGGGIKIHRNDCPNAPQMIARFGYRIIKAAWAGKSVGSQYPITLYVLGHDDIGIVANITSLISKEKSINLRSISVDSHAGVFRGNLTIMVQDNKELNVIIKKISSIRGVMSVTRS